MNKGFFSVLFIVFFVLVYSQTFDDYISKISFYDNEEQSINDSILINNYTDSTINFCINILNNNNHNYIDKAIALRILRKADTIFDSIIYINMKKNDIENRFFLKVFENKNFLDSIVDSFYTDSNLLNTMYYIDFYKSKQNSEKIKNILNAFSYNNTIRRYSLRALNEMDDTMFIDSNYKYIFELYDFNDYNTDAIINQLLSKYKKIYNFIEEEFDTHNIRMFNNFIDIYSYINTKKSYKKILNKYEKANYKEKLFIKFIIQQKIQTDTLFFDSTMMECVKKTIGVLYE